MLLLILSLLTYAEEPVVIYKKETKIDFEAVDIEGQLKKPQNTLISETNRALFNPLVQIRTTWNLEMTRSIDDIQ
tara:strand:- start:198 stop:422 length:225 start_codon:yes stop_codon:yes gene_type:complete